MRRRGTGNRRTGTPGPSCFSSPTEKVFLRRKTASPSDKQANTRKRRESSALPMRSLPKKREANFHDIWHDFSVVGKRDPPPGPVCPLPWTRPASQDRPRAKNAEQRRRHHRRRHHPQQQQHQLLLLLHQQSSSRNKPTRHSLSRSRAAGEQ